MMIEDPEFRALFKAESEERLQGLEDGLLRLEANALDNPTLDQVFRDAHSLKGAARMLSVNTVEVLAHRFEDILGAAKHGHTPLNSETVDRLYRGLDAIRQLVQEAVTGAPAEVDVTLVLAEISGEAPVPPPSAPAPPAAVFAELAPPAPPAPSEKGSVRAGISITSGEHSLEFVAEVPESALRVTSTASAQPALPAEAPAETTPAFTIETIRVDHRRLDALMALAGELTVTTGRLSRRLSHFDEIVALAEEWNKDMHASRQALHALEGGGRPGALKKLAAFHEREPERLERLRVLLERLGRASQEDVARLGLVSAELEDAIRHVRLLALSTVFNLFPRTVRDLSRHQSKLVQFIIEGGETTADKRILEEMKDPLMHMICNAVDHGIELPEERERAGKPRMGTVTLRAYQTSTNIVIELADDGRGLDLDAIQRTALRRGLCSTEELAAMTPAQIQLLIFAPGFSTTPIVTDVSGRGVGMDVVHANVERLKGTIQIESMPGQGCLYRILLPMTLATTRVLLVGLDAQTYAIPAEYVLVTCMVSSPDLFVIAGHETMMLEGQPVSVAHLSDLLTLRGNDRAAGAEAAADFKMPCIVLALGKELLGLLVDSLIDEQEMVLKPLGGMLKRVRNLAGATILGTGEVCMVLNPQDLIRSVQRRRTAVIREQVATTVERKQSILLVEDSITTRTQEKRILEAAGYQVVVAVDGLDAVNKMSAQAFDAVVSDIEMPNLNGFALTARIRQEARYKELPIILVTSLSSDEDKRHGIEVGANAYLTKSSFDQRALLETLQRLV